MKQRGRGCSPFLAVLKLSMFFCVEVSLCVVSGGGGVAAEFAPVGVEELSARSVGAFIGMGAEVVALALEQVGGEGGGAV